MGLQKIIAICLIVAGALGLAYGGFTYTKETHKADIGPLSLSVDEKQSVNIPMWASFGGVLVGTILLLTSKKII